MRCEDIRTDGRARCTNKSTHIVTYPDKSRKAKHFCTRHANYAKKLVGATITRYP